MDYAAGSAALAFIKRIRRLPPVTLLVALQGVIAEERAARSEVPLSRKLRLWRRGFTTPVGLLLGLPRPEMADYLSPFDFHRARNRINASPELLTDKYVFRSLMLSMGFPQPETLAHCEGRHILLDPFGPAARAASPDEVDAEICSRGGDFLVKPRTGGKGAGVFLVTGTGQGIRRRRGEDLHGWSAARLPARSAFLIERRVVPAEFWRQLYPLSGNTVRVLTLWTPGRPAPFVARAVQRIGTPATAPTDNFSGGGIAAPIDVETGRLGAGFALTTTPPKRVVRHPVHPDSGASIAGESLPCWGEIRDVVIRAAMRFPTNPWIGWDVLVDHLDRPVIVEANPSGGLKFVQLEKGLLHDQEIREFFTLTGVVRAGRPR